tara:strand:+ start:1547 stop:3370 length:1824 start_codon:yes stop_codon:yes gene_type:complete
MAPYYGGYDPSAQRAALADSLARAQMQNRRPLEMRPAIPYDPEMMGGYSGQIEGHSAPAQVASLIGNLAKSITPQILARREAQRLAQEKAVRQGDLGAAMSLISDTPPVPVTERTGTDPVIPLSGSGIGDIYITGGEEVARSPQDIFQDQLERQRRNLSIASSLDPQTEIGPYQKALLDKAIADPTLAERKPPSTRTEVRMEMGHPYVYTMLFNPSHPQADANGEIVVNKVLENRPNFQQSREIFQTDILSGVELDTWDTLYNFPKEDIESQVGTLEDGELPFDPTIQQKMQAHLDANNMEKQLDALLAANALTIKEQTEWRKNLADKRKEADVFTEEQKLAMALHKDELMKTQASQIKLSQPDYRIITILGEDGRKKTVRVNINDSDPRSSALVLGKGVDVQLSQLPGGDITKLNLQLGNNEYAIEGIDRILQGDWSNETGIVASLNLGLQSVIDIGKDIGSLTGWDGMSEWTSEVTQGVFNDMAQGGTEADFNDKAAEWFNPNLNINALFQNSLAYRLARVRKGVGRLNAQDFQNAREDSKIVGLTLGTEGVRTRLQFIKTELEAANTNIQNVLNRKSKSREYKVIGEGENATIVPVESEEKWEQ